MNLFFENLKASYNSEIKLYVDVDNLKRSREDIYKRFYDEILNIKNCDTELLNKGRDFLRRKLYYIY